MITLEGNITAIAESASVELKADKERILIDIEGVLPPSVIRKPKLSYLFRLYQYALKSNTEVQLVYNQKPILRFKNLIPYFNLKEGLKLYKKL